MNLGTLGEKTEPSKTAFVSLADGIHYTYADLQRISDMVAADLAVDHCFGQNFIIFIAFAGF